MNFVLLMGCSSQLVTMSPTTHIVDDSRFVSSCFSCPSSARPLLSLLLANSGRTVYTFESVNPGATGQPALEPMSTLLHHLLYNTSNISSELCHHFRGEEKKVTKLHKCKDDDNVWWCSMWLLHAVHSKVQGLTWEVDMTFSWSRNSLFHMLKV
jgi:hypothetical protein